MYTICENLSTEETPKTFLRRYLTDEISKVTEVEIVSWDGAVKDVVAYILCEKRALSEKKNGKPDIEVLIAFLKDYDVRRLEVCVCREQEFPRAFDCPRFILERLSPTTDPQALAWRQQCWLRQEHPVSDGNAIMFTVDLPLPPFIPANTPLLVEWPETERNPRFLNPQGQPFSILLWRSYPYELLPALEVKSGEVQRE